MNLFKKLKRKSDMLESIASWQISPPSDPVKLFNSLNIIIPDNSMMYFEDVYDNTVKEILSTISDGNKAILHGGTLWPKPDVYHVPATEENYRRVWEIAENHPISVHFHVHLNDTKVLEWYDAFSKDPMYISIIIDEEKIREFCGKLGLEYRKQED